MKIRKGNRKDIPVLAKLIASLEPWAAYGVNYERAKYILTNMRDQIYVAEQEGKMVGFITLRGYGMGEFGAYIRMLAVKEAYKRQGIGKALMNYACKVLKPYGRNVFCVCNVKNQAACAFVESYGFLRVGIMEDLYQKGYDEALYRKTIP
ncbi:GNAT family N-acetyltransferase [Heliobacterium gestii]|uniref:GNAT family N-acetyltransferase n=1 Tax=Heliomicrobium gestii TaxID=2699 RepID=A0A845LA38_HELGE|nr:N-acetyltransferase [Heliomicrobium gestii]MBM7867330.1 ribosomal protein S18 acetylase RimI-like enzyme [Heliomicrobium gestii]MZP43597.1 GNAT family N-acetyltransferase [Heliomicrobium gestii]